jgi:hypothetical protein
VRAPPRSYNDSVLKALPIKSQKTGGQFVLLDLAELFMTDLADIGVNPDLSRRTRVAQMFDARMPASTLK